MSYKKVKNLLQIVSGFASSTSEIIDLEDCDTDINALKIVISNLQSYLRMADEVCHQIQM